MIRRDCFIPLARKSPSPRRAWIEICPLSRIAAKFSTSPSPRRAWIEIFFLLFLPVWKNRRPPHGGRGLKYCRELYIFDYYLSPSPRRAWIEILCRPHGRWILGRRPPHGGRGLKFVFDLCLSHQVDSRPPHGGRGLKCDNYGGIVFKSDVALPTEGVD